MQHGRAVLSIIPTITLGLRESPANIKSRTSEQGRARCRESGSKRERDLERCKRNTRSSRYSLLYGATASLCIARFRDSNLLTRDNYMPHTARRGERAATEFGASKARPRFRHLIMRPGRHETCQLRLRIMHDKSIT